MPTAPEILPTAHVFGGGREAREIAPISAYQMAIFRPKVMGSAWTPWVRPISGVSLNSQARFRARRRALEALIDQAGGVTDYRAWAVSTMSLEVRP